MKEMLPWVFGLIGIAIILRDVSKIKLTPGVAPTPRPRRYPALPFIKLRLGFEIRVLSPDGKYEGVRVTDISFRPDGIVPELIYFNGRDGLPGLCHGSQAELVGVLPLPYQPGDRVQLLTQNGPVMDVLFTMPHADPFAATAYCRTLDGDTRVFPVTRLIPYPFPRQS